jgi:hypothetical protein
MQEDKSFAPQNSALTGQKSIKSDNVSPSLCIFVYSECNFEGKWIKLCGRYPDIPLNEDFTIKSVKIPKGVVINFFIDYEIEGMDITNGR